MSKITGAWNYYSGMYKVIQTSCTIVNEVTEEIIWIRKRKYNFTHSPSFPGYGIFIFMQFLLF
jgi:hypothetical protein